jgi:2-methylisocitrate lyase-like PEP mutase family enzyme
VQSVGKPINVVQSAGGIPLAELEAVGVRRVSLGGGLARVALTALKRAGEEIRATGTFKFAEDIVTTGWVNELMRR